MKNIIIDRTHFGASAKPIEIPVSLTPPFSKVGPPLERTSTVSTVSVRFEISNLKSAIPHDLARHDLAFIRVYPCSSVVEFFRRGFPSHRSIENSSKTPLISLYFTF